MIFFTIIGWLGSACLLLAYGGQAIGKIDGNSDKYLFLNLFGSLFLTVFTIQMGAYPPATVNFIWILLTLYKLRNNERPKKQ